MKLADHNHLPQDAAAAWALTMLRPLLHPRRRARFEDSMASAFLDSPRWCNNYVGGVLVCLVATLPNNDPWRHISARAGDLTAGEHPPIADGVSRDDTHRMFGTWKDATDLIAVVFTEPTSDPSFVELAEELSPEAGLLLAVAGKGDWRATRDMMAAVTAQLAAGIDDFGRSHSAVIGRLCRDVAHEAFAWALHRRMAYGGEVYAEEILLRWTILATRITLTSGQARDPEFAPAYQRANELTDHEVNSTIDRYRIAERARDGIGLDTDLREWNHETL
jgi:hypothetical protein